jgi:hypothetical protein
MSAFFLSTFHLALVSLCCVSNLAGIPQGDLFTVLEASDPEHIQNAMNVILEIEAEAAKRVKVREISV